MWAELVVIVPVGTKNVVKLAEAEAEEVVQDLSPTFSDPGLRVAIRDGTGAGRADGSAIGPFEVLVEAGGELGVAIVDQEADVDSFVLGPHGNVAGLLAHPLFVWIAGARGEEYSPAGQVDEDQGVRGPSAHGGP